jgi:hypothetical protein
MALHGDNESGGQRDDSELRCSHLFTHFNGYLKKDYLFCDSCKQEVHCWEALNNQMQYLLHERFVK